MSERFFKTPEGLSLENQKVALTYRQQTLQTEFGEVKPQQILNIRNNKNVQSR